MVVIFFNSDEILFYKVVVQLFHINPITLNKTDLLTPLNEV